MSGLEQALRRILAVLAGRERPLALVGGLAVSVRTEPRFTRDVDLAVVVEDDTEAESLVADLGRLGYRVLSIVEQTGTGRLATVRLLDPDVAEERVVIDLLFASSGIEKEVVAGAERMEVFDGLSAPVASVVALIALKVLARDDRRRPQDRVDLAALLAKASAPDLAAARDLLSRIEERGFARTRDLRASLDDAQRELGPHAP